MVQRYLIYFVKVDFIWKQKREVFSWRTSQILIEKLTLAGFQFESAPRRPTVYLYLTNERGLILIIVIIWLSRGEPRCHSIISASFSWPFKQSLIPGGDKTSSGAPGPKLKIWATHSSEQSQKNPVSASAMLTGKFLRIRKVFATSSLFAEEFPDILENVRILYKISR